VSAVCITARRSASNSFRVAVVVAARLAAADIAVGSKSERRIG
jgi:hypothetical protein